MAAVLAAGFSLLDVNVANALLNACGLGVLAMVAFRIGSKRRADATIVDQEKALAAKDARIGALEDDVAGLKERAQRSEDKTRTLETQLAGAAARYDELSQYTARESVLHFEATMAAHSEHVGEFHIKLLDRLDEQSTLISTLVERLEKE